MRIAGLLLLTAAVHVVILCWMPPPAGMPESRNPGGLTRLGADARDQVAIRRLFDRIDPDHDGVLSRQELARLGEDPTTLAADVDANGHVDREEFARSFLNVNPSGDTTDGVLLPYAVAECRNLIRKGLTQKALLRTRRLSRLFPDVASAWHILSEAADAAERVDEARLALMTAMKLSPEDIELRSAWALLCLSRGPVEKAPKTVEEMLDSVSGYIMRFPPGRDPQEMASMVQRAVLPVVNYYRDRLHQLERARTLLDWILARVPATDLLKAASRDLNDRIARRAKRDTDIERMTKRMLGFPAGSEDRLEVAIELYSVLADRGEDARCAELLQAHMLPATVDLTRARKLAAELGAYEALEQAIRQMKPMISQASANPIHWAALADLYEYAHDPAARRKALERALAECGSKVELAATLREQLNRSK